MRIWPSWPKKSCSSKSGVLLMWQACRSTNWVYWRRDYLDRWNMKGREDSTQTKDASRLSSVSLTKWRSIIWSPPSRPQTLPYWVIGWSNLTIDCSVAKVWFSPVLFLFCWTENWTISPVLAPGWTLNWTSVQVQFRFKPNFFSHSKICLWKFIVVPHLHSNSTWQPCRIYF